MIGYSPHNFFRRDVVFGFLLCVFDWWHCFIVSNLYLLLLGLLFVWLFKVLIFDNRFLLVLLLCIKGKIDFFARWILCIWFVWLIFIIFGQEKIYISLSKADLWTLDLFAYANWSINLLKAMCRFINIFILPKYLV